MSITTVKYTVMLYKAISCFWESLGLIIALHNHVLVKENDYIQEVQMHHMV